MRIRSFFILGISGLALAACAGKVLPPAIAYDSANFTAAVTEPGPSAATRDRGATPRATPLIGEVVLSDVSPARSTMIDATRGRLTEEPNGGPPCANREAPVRRGERRPVG